MTADEHDSTFDDLDEAAAARTLAAPSPSDRGQGPDTEPLLRRAADLIAAGRPMPLSASVMINKEEVLDLLDEAIERLPEELREARWLLKEREDFLAKVNVEAEEILASARAQAEQMVQRTEVVKAAEKKARQTVDAARDEASRMRLECEDFVDQKLASFEIVLERTTKMVLAGRQKLAATALPRHQPEPEPDGTDKDFFDQDDA